MSNAGTKATGVIDLRTDFISRPTEAMVEAMVAAAAEPPGMDYREDPVVSRLEALAADMLGKEDALFCPTCTQCNQIAIHAYCRPGDIFLAAASTHVQTSEAGGVAVLSGLMIQTVEANRGTMVPAAVETALRPLSGAGRSRIGVVHIENTHLRSGGCVVPESNMQEIAAIAKNWNVPLHLDGARLFNAATYLNVEPARLARHADSVAISLNKGLSAPVGAILAGSSELIAEAVDIRTRFGGAWRPAGIPAAAGIVALEQMTGCMARDHENAQILARKLDAIEGVSVVNQPVETNILFISVNRPGMDRQAFLDYLAGKGVRLFPFDNDTMRAVLHKDITTEHIDRVVQVFAEAF